MGRTASGLPLTDQRFSSLPPHFVLGEPLLEDNIYKEVINALGTLPKSFQPVLPYLIASVVHHKDFLIKHLPATHPLFQSRLWLSGLVSRLQGRVLLGCGENRESQMTATGVSPTLVVASQMKEMYDAVKENAKSNQILKAELLAEWKEGFKTLPPLISDHIRETLEINGAVAVTQGDVQRIVTAAFDAHAAMLQETTNTQQAVIDSATDAPMASAPRMNGSYFESRWRFYTWADESQQYFPETFLFPSTMTVSVLWDKWYFGEEDQAPYRKLAGVHVSSGGKTAAVIRTQKGYLSKSKGIMDKIADILKEIRSIEKVSDLYSMSYELSRTKFDEGFLLLVKRVYGTDDVLSLDNMRIGEIKYNTLYERWKNQTPDRRRKRPRSDATEAAGTGQDVNS